MNIITRPTAEALIELYDRLEATQEALADAVAAIADMIPEPEPPKAAAPDEDIRATTIKLRMPVLLALKTMALRQRRPVNDLLVEAVDDFLRLHGQEAA
jgi:hypothetical protein